MSRHRSVKDMLKQEGGSGGGGYSDYDSDDDGLERRFDTDGCAYTYDEFVEEYGGDTEWKRSKPVKEPAPAKASKAKPTSKPPPQPQQKPKSAPPPAKKSAHAQAQAPAPAAAHASSAAATPSWRAKLDPRDIEAHLDWLLALPAAQRADLSAANFYAFSSSHPAPRLPPTALAPSPLVVTAELDTFEAGGLLLGAGLRPAVMNMANEYNCGGAWCEHIGSQEEDLFRRSSLPLSLWPRRRGTDSRFDHYDARLPRVGKPIYPWTDAAGEITALENRSSCCCRLPLLLLLLSQLLPPSTMRGGSDSSRHCAEFTRIRIHPLRQSATPPASSSARPKAMRRRCRRTSSSPLQ